MDAPPSRPPPLPPRSAIHVPTYPTPSPPTAIHARRPAPPVPSQEVAAIDDPPPAYTPSPDNHHHTLQLGPQYPFGPSPSNLSQQTPANWQSGSPYQAYPCPGHPQAFSQPPLQAPSSQPYPSSSYYPLTPAGLSEPTLLPTPGRPLLYKGQTLVYPYSNGVIYFCGKCCNTGFKEFNPSRPCRKCWEKYGQSWQSLKATLTRNPNVMQGNLQRPLPPLMERSMNPPERLVVQPGDPRIGGRLCLNCNGKGQRSANFEDFNHLINNFLTGNFQREEVCSGCRGTGRVLF
ncbi:hypothetical protein O181_014982 [Austropuccinia psidii MF-1]|uniref:Uncharacterized protein n=1 Tax=Austropuccinia psidii MF-1 TaxID=1389203 RepID=A0A9Q3C189_9BASI|nr:hypothetical protein [Austropuccinia psidii MF-1]